ncbi:MAG: NUDIX domain-containing protein [Acidimicrobiales bacterium]
MAGSSGESVEAAAMRECREETGLHIGPDRIHGRLDDSWNGAGFRIAPVVASVETPVSPAVRTSELVAVATVPLALLADPAAHRIVDVDIDGRRFHDRHVRVDHDGSDWSLQGPTADIVHDLLTWLGGDDPDDHDRRQGDLTHFAASRWPQPPSRDL